jgi:hypothetical protein
MPIFLNKFATQLAKYLSDAEQAAKRGAHHDERAGISFCYSSTMPLV